MYTTGPDDIEPVSIHITDDKIGKCESTIIFCVPCIFLFADTELQDMIWNETPL